MQSWSTGNTRVTQRHTPGFELFWLIPFRLLPNKTRSGLAYSLLKVPCLCPDCLGMLQCQRTWALNLDPTNPNLPPGSGGQRFHQPASFAYSLPVADGSLRNLSWITKPAHSQLHILSLTKQKRQNNGAR